MTTSWKSKTNHLNACTVGLGICEMVAELETWDDEQGKPMAKKSSTAMKKRLSFGRWRVLAEIELPNPNRCAS